MACSQASVKAAFDMGANGAEFDIQRTIDDKVIVLHDDTLRRTGSGADAAVLDTPVNDLPFDAMRDVDIGRCVFAAAWHSPRRCASSLSLCNRDHHSWKASEFSDERVKLLEEMLELLAQYPGRSARCSR
jgi:glycerophosphoryl diester phosphodiesterase